VPALSVFLVTNIGYRFLILSILLVIFALAIPGVVLLKKLRFKTDHFMETLILGVSFASSIAILIHPLMGFADFGKYTGYLFIFIGLIALLLNSKKLFTSPSSLNLKIGSIYSFVLIPFGIWVGRQANVVPIKNFDQYSVPPDIYHHISLAAEIGNHGPDIYPYIAGSGVALQYHWGAFSLGSFLNVGGLIPLPIAMYRLEFVLLSFLLVGLLFFTGKFVGKSSFAGIAAALLGVFTLYPSYEISDGLRVPLIRTGSISQLAACVFLVASLRIFFEISEKKEFVSGKSAILTIFVMVTTLSKGPTGLLLLGIITLTSLIKIYQKDFKFGIKLLIGPFIGFFIIFPLIYTFGPSKSTGMSLWVSPFATLKTILGYYGEVLTSNNLVLISIVLIVGCLTPIPFLLLNLKSKPSYSIPLFAAIIVGILGLFIFEAWGNSQWFIYYPVGPLIAILVALMIPNLMNILNSQQILILVILGVLVQNSIFLLLRNWFEPNTLNLGLLWIISVIFISLIAFLLARFIWNHNLYKSLLAVSVSLLFIGFFSSLDYKDPYPYPVNNYEHPWSITIGTEKAADYIKKNSSINDVVATNRHCVGPEEKNTCISRIFTISALTERRTFIEGWAYTTCPVSEALNNSFWDQPLLRLNQQVMTQSDAKSAEELSKYGVQWLFIDLRRPHSNDYTNIATKEFSAGEIEVWKLMQKVNDAERPILTGCNYL
jgi:hypothetical protein